MGYFSDAAEKAVEKKVYAEGGYPALIKYKAVRMWHKLRTCSCCA